MLTAFGTASFVEGRDHSRLSTISRQRELIAPTSENDQRSQALTFDPVSGFFVPTGPESTVDDEPLPVIAPLASRIGLRLHGPERNSPWNIEFVANVVDNQDRVATSLRELLTPGYTTYDIFASQRLTDSFSVTAGVRNLTDKFYQTYFDTRQAGLTPITTVFQPGINFFFGCEYTR
jgi:outer membrane receptor protein involved in Fe transport